MNEYLDLIPVANRRQPKFVASLSVALAPLVDVLTVAASLPEEFDIDEAIGAQLDAVGVRVGMSRKLATPVEGVYFALSGAAGQFVGGAVPSAYQLPAFDYSSLEVWRENWQGARKLSPVASVRNMLTYSEDFDNAAWFKQRVQIDPNAADAPDGSRSADLLREDTSASNSHRLYFILPAVAGVAHTWSAYIRTGGRSVALGPENTPFTGFQRAFFNLQNGSSFVQDASGAGVAIHAATMTAHAGGWYRVSVTFSIASGDANLMLYLVQHGATSVGYTGDGVSGVYLWGAQLEQGTSASPYIPSRVSYTGRASDATFYGADGRVKLHKRNYASHAEAFDNAYWVKTNAAIVATNVNAPPPFSSRYGATLRTNAGNAVHVIAPNPTSTATVGATYTHSIYAKAGTHSFLQLGVNNTSNIYANFNLSDGTIGTATNVSASMVSIGNGWYRCAITFVAAVTQNDMPAFWLVTAANSARGQTWNAAGTETVFIFGAQSEREALSEYTGAGRFSYNPLNLAGPGKLLLEAAGTNLYAYSEDFNQSSVWPLIEASIERNVAVAPDGTLTADKLVENTVNSSHNVRQNVTGSVSTTYTFSVFAKAAGRSVFTIFVGGPNTSAGWNLASGSVSLGGANASIVPYPDGWFRCVFTGSTTAGSGAFNVIIQLHNGSTSTYVGDGVSGILLWGAQLETGPFATSYIPSGLSFTSRASPATYWDAAGVLQSAADNVARWNYNPADLTASPKLLLEAAATNLVLNSYFSQGSVGAQPTSWIERGLVTGRVISDPSAFGGVAMRVTSGGGQIAATDDVRQPVNGLTVGTAYTVSMRAKLAPGNTSNLLHVVFAGTQTNFTLTSAYQVFTLVRTASGTGHGLFFAGPAGLIADIDFVQVESGAFASSFIPTTNAAVTRAADISSSTTGSRAADVSTSAQADYADYTLDGEGLIRVLPDLEPGARLNWLDGSTAFPGVGFDEGVWLGPNDPLDALTSLDDETFRLLLRLKVLANKWDGSFKQMQEILAGLNNPGSYLFAQDNQDMSMTVALSGKVPSKLFVAVLKQATTWLRPAAVDLSTVYVTSANGAPIFGFDVNNEHVGGLDLGAWATPY